MTDHDMDNNIEDKRIKTTNKAVFLAAFLLVLAVLYLMAGIFFGFYIPCPFRVLTGLRCPGCGMSHAATHIALALSDLIKTDTAGAHAHIQAAFLANALFIPIFAYLIFAFSQVFKNNDLNQSKISTVIDTVFLVIIIIWWIVRNIYNI
ncbi:MAG: DUF2752 domain-containing protein [Eubacterium sp.]|nr:DUF2752 domain-containing protein [Eubacterium sp.]